MLKSQIKKNPSLRLLSIATHTTQRNNSHQGKGMSINKPTIDQHGTREETNMEEHGGLKEMCGHIRVEQ
jgi:hypothetical protein